MYILREVALQQQGQQLGELGGRLVAEVIIELLRADPSAYLTAKPDWRPTLPVKGHTLVVFGATAGNCQKRQTVA